MRATSGVLFVKNAIVNSWSPLRACMWRAFALLLSGCMWSVAVGCSTTVESPLAGHRAVYADSRVALIDRRIEAPQSSALLAAAVRRGVLDPARVRALESDPPSIDVDASGRAVMLRLQGASADSAKAGPSTLLVWPNWRDPDAFVNLSVSGGVPHFSPTVLVCDPEGAGVLHAVDLRDGSRQAIPDGVREIIQELSGSRLVVKLQDATTLIWNWRTGERLIVPDRPILGIVELSGGLCALIDRASEGLETRMIGPGGATTPVDTSPARLVQRMRMPFMLVTLPAEGKGNRWIYRIDERGKLLPLGREETFDSEGLNAVRISPDSAKGLGTRPVFPTTYDFLIISATSEDYGRVIQRVPREHFFRLRTGEFSWVRRE